MEDIAPRLLEKIQNQFNHDIAKSGIIKTLKPKFRKVRSHTIKRMK